MDLAVVERAGVELVGRPLHMLPVVPDVQRVEAPLARLVGDIHIQNVRTNITDRLREMRTRGRGVSKIPKILRTSYVHGPLFLTSNEDGNSNAAENDDQPKKYAEVFSTFRRFLLISVAFRHVQLFTPEVERN